jgi:hypothetical protein
MATNVPDDLSLPESVRFVAAMEPGERGCRNHIISRSYYEIGCKMREKFGQENADWATTAAWASGAVGVIIRHEETETSRVLSVAKHLGGRMYDDVLEQTRKNLEEGNRQVYSELGWAFAKFAALVANGVTWDPDCDERQLAFLPDCRRSVPVEWQSKTDLEPAFLMYLEALRLRQQDQAGRPDLQKSRKRQAELIFAANVLVTVAEQAGLQPYIDAGFTRVARSIQSNPLGHVPYVRGGVQVIAYSAQALGQRVVTEFGIKVPIGDQTVSVGKSIRRYGRGWAADLEVLSEPCARKVWEDYSRGRPDGRGSGAADWTVMGDRMNFITNFFRAWQQDPILLREPAFARVRRGQPAPARAGAGSR